MSFGNNLKSILKKTGKTNADLAKALEVSRALVTHWCNDIRNPNPKQLDDITRYLQIEPNELFDHKVSDVKKIPITGYTSCGAPVPNQYQGDGFALYHGSFWHKELYALVASGDSMSPEIEDGDEIICDSKIGYGSGDLVHYTIHGESAVKVIYIDRENNLVMFIPYNKSDEFKTRVVRIDSEEYEELVITKVVAVNKLKFNNKKARLRMVGIE